MYSYPIQVYQKLNCDAERMLIAASWVGRRNFTKGESVNLRSKK